MFDVVIVGAGMTGLCLAQHLLNASISVQILEARDRVGGRVYSVDGLDLGATWHWDNEPLIAELLQELGISRFRQNLDGDTVIHNGAVERIRGNVVDFESWRVAGGFGAVADALQAALAEHIRLNTPVRSIERVAAVTSDSCDAGRRPTFRVAARDGTVFEARHVVVALPPALAVHAIEFTPPLDAELRDVAARTPVWFGAMRKAVALFDEPWWTAHGLAGSAVARHGVAREWHNHASDEHAALFAFAPLPRPGQPDQLDDAALRAQLHTLFGDDVAPTLVRIQRWPDEEFTSPPGVGALTAYKLFGHAVFQRSYDGLTFASTETADEYAGHVEGALRSAARVASQLTAEFGGKLQP